MVEIILERRNKISGNSLKKNVSKGEPSNQFKIKVVMQS